MRAVTELIGKVFSAFNNLNYALLLTLNYYILSERTATATHRHLDYCTVVLLFDISAINSYDYKYLSVTFLL